LGRLTEFEIMIKPFASILITSAIILGVAIGPFTRLVSAQIDFGQFLYTQDVVVGEDTVSDYRQVYYEYNGQRHFITKGQSNSHSPFTRGEYVVYVKDIDGAGQIFLHHLPTEITTQLSFFSTNLNPSVDRNGRVAWERWINNNEKWQIFLFDNIQTFQLTSGDTSINADIDSEYLVFDRYDRLAGLWHSVGYSLANQSTVELDTAIGASRPRLVNRGLELTGLDSKRKMVFADIANVFELGLAGPPLIQPSPEILLPSPSVEIATISATPSVPTSDSVLP
jgi:hypothetical protein